MSVRERSDDLRAVLARLAALETHVEGLEEENARQASEIAGLKGGRSLPERPALMMPGRSGTADPPEAKATEDNEEALSRRGLLRRLGGAAAAGAGVAAGASMLSASRAAAEHSNTSPPADLAGYLHVGGNDTGQGLTSLQSAALDVTLKVWNVGGNGGNGLYVNSFSGIGLVAIGAQAPLLLSPLSVTGPPTSGPHVVGEIAVDKGGAIFQCVASGSPGTWVRIGLNPLTPTRIVDTRPSEGPPKNPLNTENTGHLIPGQTRTFRVAGPIGPSGSQKTLVPMQASGVVLNLTVTGTTTKGNLTVWPAGATRPLASIINWEPGVNIANGVTVKLGDIGTSNQGNISVYNPFGNTHVILDLMGFYS